VIKQRGMKLYALAAAAVLGVSQLGSWLIHTYLPQYKSVTVLPFLHFTHVRNMGGVFGIAQGKGWIFTGISFVFLCVLTAFVWREGKLRRFEYLCCGLILGGGLSNIVDRMIYGSVIDFIDVKGIPGWDYVFTTADTFIHLGIWPWLLLGWFLPRPTDEAGEAADAGEKGTQGTA